MMADHRWKRPDRVLHHAAGAYESNSGASLSAPTNYQNPPEIQRRRLRLRHGLSEYQAALVASLLFGEGRR
jgi:hypothetical protein